jgi:hypothetical protein
MMEWSQLAHHVSFAPLARSKSLLEATTKAYANMQASAAQ